MSDLDPRLASAYAPCWGVVVVCLALTSCKPQGEPDFPYGAPPDGYLLGAGVAQDRNGEHARTGAGDRREGLVGSTEKPAHHILQSGSEPASGGLAASMRGINLALDYPEAVDPATEPATDPGTDSGTEPPGGPHPVGEPRPGALHGLSTAGEGRRASGAPGGDPREALDPALLAALEQPSSRAQRATAKRLNRKGLRLHTHKRVADAIPFYEAALKADPRALYPRYNLACALALVGRREEALTQLRLLKAAGHPEKLRDARVDPDLDSLRADPRFVALTGFARVAVRRMARVPQEAAGEAAAWVRQRARQPAVAQGLTPVPSRTTQVFFRPGYRAAANDVAEVFGQAPVSAAGAGFGAVAADVVLLIAEASDVAAVGTRALQAWLDRRLEGRSGRSLHVLTLKSTGFFVHRRYDRRAQRSTVQQGTFKVVGTALERRYEETQETEEVASPPVERDDRVSYRASAKVLKVDGVKYTR